MTWKDLAADMETLEGPLYEVDSGEHHVHCVDGDGFTPDTGARDYFGAEVSIATRW